MFDMNPLNLPDAQMQQLIMLFVAGTLGFIIGYVERNRTARQLEAELSTVERAVDDCQRMPAATVPGSDEDIVLNRIRTRASELDLDRIGIASLAQADDLKEISGVGPFLEKKMHAIGIYTFAQVARFTPEDVDKVNDIIEFFPGRIERDNWVGQAQAFVNRK
ncbi:MAG: hypothetical protein H7319_01295 [Spirosoma sp.]|nr:hypothetical protein [Spirosoma sp.]